MDGRDGRRERVSSNFEKKIGQYVRNILRKNLVGMKRGYLSGRMIPLNPQSGRRPPVRICDFPSTFVPSQQKFAASDLAKQNYPVFEKKEKKR